MSRRDYLAVGGQSRRVLLLLLALIGTVVMASPVLAQNGQRPNTPPRPFQEEGTAPTPPKAAMVLTPQTQTDELEAWAKDREAKQWPTLERERYYRILTPHDRAEFDALGRYGILLLTIVTRSAQELPLKRIYLRMPDREIPILKVASWRRDVLPTLVTYKMYGPYREDAFYLFPLGAYFRVAQVQVDFAINRLGWPVMELPYQHGPDWLKTMQNPDPLPGALPKLRALQAFIKSQTSGFPIPTSLPQVAPEARRPVAEPSPQLDEARNPAASKKLCSEGRCEP
jgi:hypothetical protein